MSSHITIHNHIYKKNDQGKVEIHEEVEKEFGKLWKSIKKDLLWSPGQLIYIKNESKRDAVRRVIDAIWSDVIDSELLEEITGEYSDILVSIMGDYLDNAKLLTPTFISIDPNRPEFRIYYDEAMRAWLFGLYNSALIICCSLIEDVLQTELYNINFDLAKEFNPTEGGLKGFKNKR